MKRATRRSIRRAFGPILAAAMLAGLCACETTTQRCMKERESCVEACKGKEKEGDCNDACDDALNKCMAE